MNKLSLPYVLMMRLSLTWLIITFVLVAFSYAGEKSRVITLECEIIEGEIESIAANGLVNIKDQDLTLDGLRSIIRERSETTDLSGSEFIAGVNFSLFF